MSSVTARLVVLGAFATLASLVLVSACGGGTFQSDAGGAGNAAGSSPSGGNGSGGTGGGTTLCGGPEDCDDGDVCTSDVCSSQGTCTSAAKCAAPAKCCEGDCAECCDDGDCDDGVACTTNTCFASQCMFLPDDAACGAEEYCSVTEGCRPKVACGPSLPTVTCQDSSSCTSDSCQDGFCRNEFCEQGALCCPTGCASQCCNDAQCQPKDDPCTIGTCQEGSCSTAPLCAAGDKCCPSADGKTATCGSCCSADECDDGVECTDDTCTGARLSCGHNPNSANCNDNETCHPETGCTPQVECDAAGDCGQGACGRCEQRVCHYGCPSNQQCCQNTNTCATCCGDQECSDGIACTVDECGAGGCTHTPDVTLCPTANYQCLPELGGCVQCTSDVHCDDGNSCTEDSCNPQSHTCSHISTCECQTGFDCQLIIAKAALPIPPEGDYCHACVDGKCQSVICYGSCCSSGCYIGLCPD